MGAKKKSLANRLAKMSDEERARYLQHKADMEEEARRRKEQLIATFIKVWICIILSTMLYIANLIQLNMSITNCCLFQIYSLVAVAKSNCYRNVGQTFFATL